MILYCLQDFVFSCKSNSSIHLNDVRDDLATSGLAITQDASVEDDTKRVQSALCTRMRIVFFSIRLGPKTSV